MAAPLSNPHSINQGVVSLNGEIAGDNQIKVVSDANNNDIVQPSSNFVSNAIGDITGTLRTVRDRVATLGQQSVGALAPLIPKVLRLVGISNVFDPARDRTEVVIAEGTHDHVDLDFALSGNARERYADDDVTVDLTARTITGIDSNGFDVFAINVDASATGTLVSVNDQAGTRFPFLRVNAGKIEWNNYLPATADTDTQLHNADIPLQTGQSSTISNTNTSIAFNLPTTDTLEGAGDLQMDSIVDLHFDLTLNDHLSGDAQRTRISINRSDRPAGNTSQRWDDTTTGFVDETTIYYAGNQFRIQYQISGAANARVFTWRIHPDDVVELGSRFTFVNRDHYLTYYLDNGRAAANNWTAWEGEFRVGTDQETKWTAINASSDDYKVIFQLHPSGRVTGHTVVVSAIELADGTRIEALAPTMNAVSVDTSSILLASAVTDWRSYANDFAHHLTSDLLADLLGDHFDDQYALGTAANHVLGTESEVAGDLNVTGKLYINNERVRNAPVFRAIGASVSQNDALYTITAADENHTIAINVEQGNREIVLPDFDADNVDDYPWGWQVRILNDGAASDNILTVRAAQGNRMVGRGSGIVNQGSSFGSSIASNRDSVILSQVGDSVTFERANNTWVWPTAPIRYTANVINTRVTRTVSTNISANWGWIGKNNAIATVANRTIILPDNVGNDGDRLAVSLNIVSTSIAVNVSAAQIDGTGFHSYVLQNANSASNKIMTFMKQSGRWYPENN